MHLFLATDLDQLDIEVVPGICEIPLDHLDWLQSSERVDKAQNAHTLHMW